LEGGVREIEEIENRDGDDDQGRQRYDCNP
jgi:hypothetical protein